MTLRARVLSALSDGRPWSLRQLEARCQPCTQTSVSARIRELRRGGERIEKEHRGRGLWVYTLRPSTPPARPQRRPGAVSPSAPPTDGARGSTAGRQMDLAEVLE